MLQGIVYSQENKLFKLYNIVYIYINIVIQSTQLQGDNTSV